MSTETRYGVWKKKTVSIALGVVKNKLFKAGRFDQVRVLVQVTRFEYSGQHSLFIRL